MRPVGSSAIPIPARALGAGYRMATYQFYFERRPPSEAARAIRLWIDTFAGTLARGDALVVYADGHADLVRALLRGTAAEQAVTLRVEPLPTEGLPELRR